MGGDARARAGGIKLRRSLVLGPRTTCGALAPRGRLEFDEHDIRRVARSVEDDLLSVGTDVEAPHAHRIVESSQLTAPARLQVEQPEVLRDIQALHINQSATVR